MMARTEECERSRLAGVAALPGTATYWELSDAIDRAHLDNRTDGEPRHVYLLPRAGGMYLVVRRPFENTDNGRAFMLCHTADCMGGRS